MRAGTIATSTGWASAGRTASTVSDGANPSSNCAGTTTIVPIVSADSANAAMAMAKRGVSVSYAFMRLLLAKRLGWHDSMQAIVVRIQAPCVPRTFCRRYCWNGS